MTTFGRAVVVREAIANVLAHRVLATIVVLVSALVPLWVVSVGIIDVHGITVRQQQLLDRGINVLVVTAVDGTQLPAARCDRLNSVTGVLAAGAIVDARQEHTRLPDHRFVEVRSGTPGIPLLYWPGEPPADNSVVVGATVAEDLGLVPKALLPLDSVELRVFGTAGPSVRSPDFDQPVVQVVPPTGEARECLVEAVPGSAPAVEAVLLGWFEGYSTAVHPFFTAPDSGRPPQQELTERLTLWLPLLGGVLVAGLLLAWWTIRRHEFALYSVMGLRTSGLVLMLVTEWAVLCLVPGCVGLANALVAAQSMLESAVVIEAAALDVWRYLGTVTVIPALGCLALTRVSALDSLKGR